MELKDKVIAITGGASGLGEASTRHFVSQGAKVMILDINDDNAKSICGDLGDDSVKYVNTNIMEEEPVKKAMSKIQEEFGQLHVAINCAGTGYGARIIGKDAPHPLDHFKFIIDLNLVGTFNVMRLAAELMDKNESDKDGEKGVIINTASIAGYEGQIGQSAYSASKAGVIGLTLTAARDLARHGIRVNTIAPGIFDTPLMNLAAHIVENTYLNGETIRLDSAMRMKPR